MAEKKKYNSILVSGRKDQTLTYTKFVKDEESGESVKESLDKKVNVTDELETQQIKDGAITNEKMAADSVGNTNLQDGSVSNEKLEDGSITNEKLAENSITKDKLKDNTIGVEKLDPELRQTINAATGLPDDLVETIQNVDDTLKDHQSQLDDKQSQIDDKQQQITSNDEDISLLQTRSTQMEETIKGIAATGGASQATAVTYDNENSKLTAVNIQSAVDEVVDKTAIKDEEGNVQDTPFRVIENEEFIKAIADSEDKILFGFRRDTGKPYYPLNEMYHVIQNEEFLWVILDAANHPLLGIQQDGTCWAAKAQWLDDIKAIKEVLSSIDKTLKTFQPKEDGKGLINIEIADSFFYISNDEYIIAVVDAENRILAGIKYDGEPYFPNHEMYSVTTNEEWLYAIIDAEDKVLGGFRADDGHMIVGGIDISTFIANAIIDIADFKERTAHLSTIDNDEYLSVETDADGKVVGYTSTDGSHYFYKLKSETINNKVDKEEGKSLINSEFADAQATNEDPEERTEIKTDALCKVVSYRDKEGFLNEEVGIKTKELSISKAGLEKLAVALKGKGSDVVDWSNNSFIKLPEPRLAVVNIYGIDEMPWSKTQNLHAWMEFWDMQGNYFKKKVIVNAQGDSSLGFVKRNLAIDICNDDWIGDDTTKVKFGIWVSQDSFHMKAYYTDFFRGVGAVAYKLYDEIVKTRGNMYDRPWKKALLDMNHVGVTTKSFDNYNAGDFSLLTDTGARCFPDGFPIALYHNGNFYGIFSFQLKKHRDNFHLEKSKPTNIHLDGILGASTIFSGADSIDWSQFEVRNPKSLYAIGGNKYDADIRQEELAGNAEVDAWIANNKLPDGTSISSKIKKNLQITAKVKEYIQSFADIIPSLKSMAEIYESSQKTEEDLNTLKSSFEKRFDVENLIDYIIILDITGNGDGTNKNWQWFTYDGVKWWVELYDCDGAFGGDYRGVLINKPKELHQGDSISLPTGYILKYYKDELETRYKELVNLGLISANHIFSLLKDWTMRIGTEYIKEEYNKWSDSPCISNSVVRSDYWNIVLNTQGEPDMDISGITEFAKEKSYSIGDIVYFGINNDMGLYKFKCIKPTEPTDTEDNLKISKFSPIKQYKHCDSIYRAQKWIEQNIKNMNLLYNLK